MHGGARRVDVFGLHADRQAGVTHTLVVERERQALRTYTNHYNNATGPASGRLPLLLRRLHRRKLGLVVSQQHKGGVVVEATQLGLLGARAGEAASSNHLAKTSWFALPYFSIASNNLRGAGEN